ncbi:hypothetical protein V6Z11_A08G099900 [Gossypium hirsutum]
MVHSLMGTVQIRPATTASSAPEITIFNRHSLNKCSLIFAPF